jgi:phosphatidylserine decarboxylase
MARSHPLLAREGWVHIALTVGAAAVVHYLAGPWWAAPLWLVAAFVLQFFRDPPRAIPADPGVVVSPADGRVIVVDEAPDPFLNRPARRVSIFMNVFNVHSNRSPVAGEVKQRWYHRGSFLNAALDKAALENERNALWLRSEEGADLVVVQVAGLIARRILCHVEPGARLQRGERYGFIRFGSRLDVYLPAGSRVRVALGDTVKSGRDIIADLPPGARP